MTEIRQRSFSGFGGADVIVLVWGEEIARNWNNELRQDICLKMWNTWISLVKWKDYTILSVRSHPSLYMYDLRRKESNYTTNSHI